MSFEADLQTRLIEDAAVAAIIGTRVFWQIRPQDEPLPAIVLTIVSDPRPQHLEGFQPLRDTRVQVDCYARTYLEAVNLREAAINVIVPRHKGATTRFDHGFINNVIDRGEDDAVGFVHRQLIDATIWQGPLE